MSAPDIHTLAGAYALDAIDDLERAAFSRHLAGCEACGQEVAELRETVARLGAAAAQAPPPGLRTRVLAEIARTRQHPAPVSMPAVREPRWRRLSLVAAAAAVLAAGASATTWIVADQRARNDRAQLSALRAEHDRLDAVLTAPDTRVHDVAVTGGGHVTAIVSPSRDAGVVVLGNLPVPPSGRVYQLWLLDRGNATSAGIMADGQGGGVALVDGIDAAEEIGVTLEPSGGSSAPTTPPIVIVPLRA